MLIRISSNQLSVSLQSELRPWLLLHGEWAACQRSSTQSDYFVTVRMSVCGNVKGLCDFSNSALWLSLTRRGWFPSSYCRPHSDALILNRSEIFSFFFLFAVDFFPLIFDSWPSLGDVVFAVTWARRYVAWVSAVCRRRTTTGSLCCCRRLITATTLPPARSSPPHPHPHPKTWSAPNPWSFMVMVLISTHLAHQPDVTHALCVCMLTWNAK